MAKRNEPRRRSPRHTTATHQGIYNRALFILYWAAFGLHRSQNSRGTRGVCPRPRVLSIVTSSKSLRQEARRLGEFDYLGQRVAGSRLNLNEPFDDDAHGLKSKETNSNESSRIAESYDIAFLFSNECGPSIRAQVCMKVSCKKSISSTSKFKKIYIIYILFSKNICVLVW